jgi:hypothetical protein
MTTVTKLISRSFSTATMGERIRKDLGAKAQKTRGNANGSVTEYRGTAIFTEYGGNHQGVDYTITCMMTRHMGDYTELHVEREDFPSMAALCRFYRDLKNQLTHQRYNYW